MLLVTDLSEYSLIPQATIGQPPRYFSGNYDVEFNNGNDDLDNYENAELSLNGVPFALHRYAGEPTLFTNIFLPEEFDLFQINEAVGAIMAHFGLEDDDLIWIRTEEAA